MGTTDFWWLPEDKEAGSYLIEVGHHRPLTEDDNPKAVDWFHSLDMTGQFSAGRQPYPLNFVLPWRRACTNTNVYRSLRILDAEGNPFLLGPFLVDIDNCGQPDGHPEDLDDALRVAQITATVLMQIYRLAAGDICVFFSGRKGFNVEIRPGALGIRGSFLDQVADSRQKLYQVVTAVQQANQIRNGVTNVVSANGTVVDLIYGSRHDALELKHPYVRLHNSINKWVQTTGTEIARMRIEVDLEELFRVKAEDISREAEGRASGRS